MEPKGRGCTRQRTGPRTPWFALGVGALLSLLLVLAATRAGAVGVPDAQALACPSGQVTWLRGATTPGRALLAVFAGVPVGGGSAGADGTWAIPITVRERPGSYPVAVQDRRDGTVVATFTCFVDLPIGAAPTATPTAPPTPTAAPLSATATSRPPSSPTRTVADTTSPTTLPPRGSPDLSPSATTIPPATETPATETPATPSPTPTESSSPVGEAPPLVLAAVEADDPEEPGLAEYVIVENTSLEPAALAGWRLVHAERGEAFAFPARSLPAGELLVIWSDTGVDDPAAGRLYWPTARPRWTSGQTVELFDPSGRRVGALVVEPAAPSGP